MSLSCTDDLDDGNERNHDDYDGEHQPSDTVRPARVDVVTESNGRVVDQREHEQKLHNRTILGHRDGVQGSTPLLSESVGKILSVIVGGTVEKLKQNYFRLHTTSTRFLIFKSVNFCLKCAKTRYRPGSDRTNWKVHSAHQTP